MLSEVITNQPAKAATPVTSWTAAGLWEDILRLQEFLKNMRQARAIRWSCKSLIPAGPAGDVITSYSIHYTKLYEPLEAQTRMTFFYFFEFIEATFDVVYSSHGFSTNIKPVILSPAHSINPWVCLANSRRITSYNVCYTKLLRFKAEQKVYRDAFTRRHVTIIPS